MKKISNLGSRQQARNEREAGFLAACSHGNILRVIKCYRVADTDTVWLAMEMLEGGALDEALRLNGPLGNPETARCAADLTAALAYLHAKGWCHRDLK